MFVGLLLRATWSLSIPCCLIGCKFASIFFFYFTFYGFSVHLYRCFATKEMFFSSFVVGSLKFFLIGAIWFRYPSVFSVMLRSVQYWADCSDVMSAVLKLLVELCQNRQQRLQFEMSSCSAVLLFREASKIICSYGLLCGFVALCFKKNVLKLTHMYYLNWENVCGINGPELLTCVFFVL